MKNKGKKMSEELQGQVKHLEAENAALKQSMQQNSAGIQTLLAQVDAHKQMLNEGTQINVNLRTNFILLQKQNQELVEKLKKADAKLVELENKVAENKE